MSTDLVSDEDDEAAASFSAALIALVGSVAIWAAIASSGSIEKPRMAVTAPVEEDVAVVNAEGVLIPDTGAEKLERRRNMAEGFSLDNIPRICEPFPGQKKWTVQPYPSGKGIVPNKNTQI